MEAYYDRNSQGAQPVRQSPDFGTFEDVDWLGPMGSQNRVSQSDPGIPAVNIAWIKLSARAVEKRAEHGDGEAARSYNMDVDSGTFRLVGR